MRARAFVRSRWFLLLLFVCFFFLRSIVCAAALSQCMWVFVCILWGVCVPLYVFVCVCECVFRFVGLTLECTAEPPVWRRTLWNLHSIFYTLVGFSFAQRENQNKRTVCQWKWLSFRVAHGNRGRDNIQQVRKLKASIIYLFRHVLCMNALHVAFIVEFFW